MAGIFSLLSKLFSSKSKANTDYQLEGAYSDLRSMVFKTKPSDIGLQLSNTEVNVWGLLMETGYPEAVATLVALADGTVSFYFSNGGGIIGLGQHDGPRKASESFLQLAPQILTFCSPAKDFPLPLPANTRFYVLTNKGIVTAEVKEEDLGYNRHALSPLFHQGHELISEIRVANEKHHAQQSARPDR